MTIILIALTVLISISCFTNHSLYQRLIHNPYLTKHHQQWYRMLTSGFMHADYMHLFINMFVLYSFGKAVEYYYQLVFGEAGTLLFITLYLTAIIASSASTQFKYQNSSGYSSLGASGAVSAVVFTSILFAPFQKIYLYGLIGFPGILLGLAYLAYSYYMSKKDLKHDTTNHEAHFYGAVYGVVFTLLLKPNVFLIFLNQLGM